MVKNLPSNAGDKGSIAGQGGPHTPQLLSPHALEPVLHNKRSHSSKKFMHHNWREASLATTSEIPHGATNTRAGINK